MKRSTRDLALLVGAAAAFASAIALQVIRDRRFPRDAHQVEQILYVRSGAALRRMTLSFDALAADIYWIRAIQHYGGDRLSGPQAQTKYQLLYPLLDLTTTLDPYFNIAYRFGAIFLSEGYPSGPGRPDLALKLLDKGFAVNPTRWQYLYDKAFVAYWSLKDYQAAARWFSEAAKVKGAPEWMPGLAAFMLGQGGDRRSSRFLWKQILDTAEQPYMRDNATFHLTQLDMADLADQLTAVLQRYRAQTGQAVMDFAPLVRAGWLRATPTDPEGVAFVIDPQTGRATLHRPSRYAPLPDEQPGAAAGPR